MNSVIRGKLRINSREVCMSCSVSEFGFTKSGVRVNLYTLKNARGMEASFIDLGAVWVSMKTSDRNGKLSDIVLGYDTVEKYELNPPHFGAIIGRCANRIAEGKFTLDGKKYQLQINNEVNSLHSGPDYWGQRMWEGRMIESEGHSGIEFHLHSPDGDQGYGGNADIRVRYILTEDALEISYEFISDQRTVCNLTNHAYFNLAGHEAGDILDQEVMILADSFLPTDQFLIPLGEEENVEETPMDLRVFTAIGAHIDEEYAPLLQAGGYDHNWNIQEPVGEVKCIAAARDPKSGRMMEVYSDLPGVQFYTGNSLRGELTGKDGADYPRRSGYCFETQFFPNSVNMPQFQQPFVEAGEVFTTKTIYRFPVE